MKNNFKIRTNYLISASMVVLLIFSMCYISLQNKTPRWDICYTANFPGMHVELYPQYSVSKEYCIYQDFILKLNHTPFRKDWQWRAASAEEVVAEPVIYYADINQDQGKELIFVFWDRLDGGTGVCHHSVYITDAIGNDHAIGEPMQYLKENLQTALHVTKNQVVIDITIDGTSRQLFYDTDIFPDLKTLGSTVGYPDWTEYYIDDNSLYAKIPFIAYQGMVLGYYHLRYAEIDGTYIVNEVLIEQLAAEEI